MLKRRSFSWIAFAGIALASAGCMVGPNYKRPSAPAPPAFKEQPPENFKEASAEGWKQSQPGDAYAKGKWWEVYNDPALNALEEQVGISNQNVQQAEALYRQAKGAVGVAHAALFPVITTAPSISASQSGGGGSGFVSNGNVVGNGAGAASASSAIRTSYVFPFDVSWAPDLWGNIRRGVTANINNAQALAADVENARLLYQAELAQDYFGLHGIDAQVALLARTEASYEEFLTLTRNRFAAGVASGLDVSQAQTQLYDLQSQLIDLGVQRAAYEHAIAILIGKPPAELTIPTVELRTPPPAVPVELPSELLERRPDIAAAERRVAAANEQIGIAMAAFFPTLNLGGSAGFASSSIGKLISWPSRFWSVGPQLAETLFDAGRRRSVVAEQRAAYDASVAAYRQTVLTAFQQVEDNLAALRILENESAKVGETIDAAGQTLRISSVQYQAGTADYLTVITAQASLLNAQRTAVALLTRRDVASVALIEALGGGWRASELPSAQQVRSKS
ncbi:MAG TPA: efflux transporter outer membrane subunit [Bryobacteraceae bacterium]|nr:efflux transporter outer membrane subunit [Bryobacteraceae bacterium]